MRICRSFGQMLSFVNNIAFLNNYLLCVRDEMLFVGVRFFIGNNELALRTNRATEGHNSIQTGHLGSFLRAPGFKKLSDSGQTTGDILSLGCLTRRFRQ